MIRVVRLIRLVECAPCLLARLLKTPIQFTIRLVGVDFRRAEGLSGIVLELSRCLAKLLPRALDFGLGVLPVPLRAGRQRKYEKHKD